MTATATPAPAAPLFLVDNRNLFFLQQTVNKLNQWLWEGSPLRPNESRLFTTRARNLSTLKQVISEAAERETPQAPAASLGWVNQVFATVTAHKNWPLLFGAGLSTKFIHSESPARAATLPPVAISTGLFVAILVEVWAWTLGNDEYGVTGPPVENEAPLGHIQFEPATQMVRLTFRARKGSAFSLPSPPPELVSFLQYLGGIAPTFASANGVDFRLPAVQIHRS